MSLRERKEIQEMLRRLIPVFILAVCLQGAILPESFGPYRRGPVSAVTPEDPAIWKEYGLTGSETAQYAGDPGAFTATVWRLGDPTGAFAAFQWQRPANAQSGATSASIPGGSLVLHNNYLVRIEGRQPHPAVLADLYKNLPNVVSTSLPPLYGELPKRGRVPNSERYLLGPEALARFEPRISASLAAFERGAEAQLADYRVDGKTVRVAIFSYPTPQMAMERARAFESLSGALIARSGPLLTVVPDAAGSPGAKKLLKDIAYRPNLTWSEHVPKDTPQDAARMVLAIVSLAGILILMAAAMGILFGGSRVLAGKFGLKPAHEEFTSLHLGEK